jgi:hypothetical protein
MAPVVDKASTTGNSDPIKRIGIEKLHQKILEF